VRWVALLVFTLACGGMVVPDDSSSSPQQDASTPLPASHDYQIGFNRNLEVNIWHSSNASVALAPYAGNPVFTHDGSMFVAVDVACINDPATTPPLLDFVTSAGAVVRTVPSVSWFGVRGDGHRLALVDKKNALSTWDIDGTLGPTIATNVDGRALYAPDDKTLVFTRSGQIVTMSDDGTNEEVIVQSDASEPSFSWNGTEVVYAAGRKSVDVINRSTREIRMLFAAPDGQFVWTPVLTPDGAYVVFVVGNSHFEILRQEIASGTIDVLVKPFPSNMYVSGPGFEMAVAPDVTSK
jgi:hypothetical protein